MSNKQSSVGRRRFFKSARSVAFVLSAALVLFVVVYQKRFGPAPTLEIIRTHGDFACAVKQLDSKVFFYILGGAEDSQRFKLQKAADLYRQGLASTVWMMHEKGITAYDAALGRNLTQDEWAVREAYRAGIPPSALCFIEIEDRFFGTFSEARTVAAVCREKGLERLRLVCAGYHARRGAITFSALLNDTGVKIEIFSADEPTSRIGLLYEFVKHHWYQTILLPLWRLKNKNYHARLYTGFDFRAALPCDVPAGANINISSRQS